MKRILFVDDEPRVLEGLRRALRGEAGWEVDFAEGGEEGLGLAVRKDFDVVVSDIRMPGMDGAAFLRAVRERYPGAIRLALSGYFDIESAVRSSPVAHQFLAKPCDRAVLRATIDRALRLGGQLGNETVRTLVAEVGEAPCLPETYHALRQTLDNPAATLRDLTQIAEQDIGVAAKVMQMVNSPFFGLAYGVATVQAAVGALGLDILRELTLSAEAFQPIESWPNNGGDTLQDLQAHSRLAAAIAVRLPVAKRCVPSVSIAALLHDVGRLVLATRLPEAFDATARRAQAHRRPIYSVEREMMGATHAEAGAYLLGLWGYSDDIVEAVLHHHAPSGAENTNTEFGTVAAVHVANALARELNPHDSGGPDADGLDMPYLEKLGVADQLPAWRELTREVACKLRSAPTCLRAGV